MALDHSRLGLENKFLENKSGRIFCVRQVYFTKSCQQIWLRVNQPFIPFIHHIWGETVLWGTVFIIQTSDRMQYFTILQKFPKSAKRLAGSHFCSASCGRVFEWTLTDLCSNIINNLLCLFFIQWFYWYVIFKSVWYARHFEYSCKRCSLNDWKQTAQRLKLQNRLLTINKRNIIRWNIYRDNNFHSQRQVSKV